MSINLTVNGVTYAYPETNDVDWGPDGTDWASAVTSGMLQKAGGLFQLLAEVDFGTTYGLKSVVYKTRTANIAAAGQFRLARADVIAFRNEANSADLNLGVSSSDVLQFNGVDVQSAISVSDTSTIDLTLTGTTLSAAIVSASITNALVSNSAAIAYSKLNLSASIVNADISNSAAIAYSKLNLTGSIVNADISASAAIENSKLAQMATLTIKGNNTGGSATPSDLSVTQVTAMLDNFVGDSGSGGTKGLVPAPASGDAAAQKFLKADGTWTTPPGSGDVVGPASSTDSGFARFDGTDGKLLKNSPATISNADVAANAAIDFSKLSALASGNILVGNGSNVAASVAMSGAITIDNAGATTYNGTVPVNKGGTNSTTALNNNRIMQSSSGSIVEAAAITASRAVVSDANGIPTHSTTTATEIAALSGITVVSTSGSQTLTNKDLTSTTNTYREASASQNGAVSTGTQTFAGFKLFNDSVYVTKYISTERLDTAATGTVNGLVSTSTYVRFTATTTITLNGINPGNNGQILIVENQTANPITVNYNNGSGVTNGKIYTPAGATKTISNLGAQMFIYNGSTGVWVWVGA